MGDSPQETRVSEADRDEACPLACGACCVDHGIVCIHLTDTGCTWPRDSRPVGCNRYLCGVARAVLDGRLTVEYGLYLKQWERDAEKLKTDTAGFMPFEETTT